MQAYQISGTTGLDTLRAVELPDPRPGPGEVLIRVRANSLNYRDLSIARGGYPRNTKNPVIPLSDMAGEVAAVGAGVERFREGDRVSANFMRDWVGGRPSERVFGTSLGGGLDGTLAEYVVFPEHALVTIPEHLSFEEAATLPCAAVTAWHALAAADTRPGETVLLLGTGGVSIFGLQLAKAFGAEVIITSSSDDKLAKARELGADHAVNYRERPEWHEPVRTITGDRGVDHVLEVGGPGTLERSLKSMAVGGTVSLIGLLEGAENQPSILPAMMNGVTIRGIYVGSAEMFEAMNRAISANRIRPVVDRVFPFAEARSAYEYFSQQKHVGKVVIAHT